MTFWRHRQNFLSPQIQINCFKFESKSCHPFDLNLHPQIPAQTFKYFSFVARWRAHSIVIYTLSHNIPLHSHHDQIELASASWKLLSKQERTGQLFVFHFELLMRLKLFKVSHCASVVIITSLREFQQSFDYFQDDCGRFEVKLGTAWNVSISKWLQIQMTFGIVLCIGFVSANVGGTVQQSLVQSGRSSFIYEFYRFTWHTSFD